MSDSGSDSGSDTTAAPTASHRDLRHYQALCGADSLATHCFLFVLPTYGWACYQLGMLELSR